jgi:hypothetical protein
MDELLQKLDQYLKLEWITESSGTSQPPEGPRDAAASGQPDVVAPPPEALRALLDLTRKGLVNQIEKYMNNLDRSDPKYVPFTKNIRYFLKDFRLSAAEAFLSKYIDGHE